MIWPGLIPEPIWDGGEFTAFAIELQAVRNSVAGPARGRSYYQLGEALRIRATNKNQSLLDASAYSFIEAHVHQPLAAAYINLGVVLQRASRYDHAAAALRLALHHRPDHGAETAAAYRNLGMLMRRVGNISAAEPLLHVASKLNPLSSDLLHTHGEVLLRLSRAAEAVGALDAASRLAPAVALHRFGMGTALLRTHRLAEAASAFEAAKRLDPAQAVVTARNDAREAAEDMQMRADAEARRWAMRTARAVMVPPDTAASQEGSSRAEEHQADVEPVVVEMRWLQADDPEAKGEEAGVCGAAELDEPKHSPCAVVDTGGSAQRFALELAVHSAKGLPVLLRNASVGWPVHGDAFEAERLVRLLRQLPPAPSDRATGQEVGRREHGVEQSAHARCRANRSHAPGCALLPVSIVFDDGRSNQIVRFDEVVAGRLPPTWRLSSAAVASLASQARAALRARQASAIGNATLERQASSERRVSSVADGILQRPLKQYMHAATLLSLLERGACSRCYAKQVDLPLHLPSLLSLLHPPPLRPPAYVLGEANLWLGGIGGVASQRRAGSGPRRREMTTDLHSDGRPNLLVALRGRKRALLVPPTDAADRLRPAVLIDVPTRAAEAGAALREEQGEPGFLTEDALRGEQGEPGFLTEDARMEVAQPQLPSDLHGADVAIDRNHYLTTLEEVRRALRPRDAGRSKHTASREAAQARDEDIPARPCSYVIRPPDALYIPPRWAHAVETSAMPTSAHKASANAKPSETTPFAAAINFFYDAHV